MGMEVNWSKLEDLYEEIRADPNFDHLRVGKNSLVPGEGDSPKVMIIGEAPGGQEAIKGRPFVGPAGIVLRRLMYLVGLNSYDEHAAKNCWITNVVKYRPPRNRTPILKEIRDSRGYLRREWLYIGKPSIIVTIGAVPLSALYSKQFAVSQYAGSHISNFKSERKPQALDIWPMYHTAYGLRYEPIRKEIEKHWDRFGEWLDNHPRFHSR